MRITDSRAVLFESPDPVTPTPPDGDIGGLIDRVEPGLPVPDPDDACGAPGARGVRSAVSGAGPLVLRDRVADHRERRPSVGALRVGAIGGRGR